MGSNQIIRRPSKLSPTCHLPPLAPKRALLSVGSQDSRPRHIFHGRRPSRPRTWGVARDVDFPLQERELADAEEPNAAGTERITYERSWSARESAKFDRLEWGSRRPDPFFLGCLRRRTSPLPASAFQPEPPEYVYAHPLTGRVV